MDDPAPAPSPSDTDLVTRVVAGELDAFTLLMQRYNRRLFRVVRAIVPTDAEAEDACQDAWLRAYRHLDDLQQMASFSSWIAKIGLRCALERRQIRHRTVSLDELDATHAQMLEPAPDGQVEVRELARRFERALEELAPSQRAVVMLRDIEDLSTRETASILGLTEENVRVRLHRARASLRERLLQDFGASELGDVFRFDGDRCGRLTRLVMTALADVSAS